MSIPRLNYCKLGPKESTNFPLLADILLTALLQTDKLKLNQGKD